MIRDDAITLPILRDLDTCVVFNEYSKTPCSLSFHISKPMVQVPNRMAGRREFSSDETYIHLDTYGHVCGEVSSTVYEARTSKRLRT